MNNIAQVFKGGKLNHIAVAYHQSNPVSAFYKSLGARVSKRVELEEHGVVTVFVEFENTKIELLEPLGLKSPILNFLTKNSGGGIHHLCFDVEDLDKSIQEVEEKKIRLLGPKKIGAHGKPVVFLHPKDCHGLLLELQQK